MSAREPLPVLERGSLPLYAQVSGLVRRRLEAGEWRVGDRIPTIDALMAEYRVSRVTMRQAIAQLEADGLLKRGQGRGTFVTGDATTERWLILPTEWRALVEHIAELDARVVELESGLRPPPEKPGRVLASAYWFAQRVNYTERAPYSMTTLHLATDWFDRDPKGFKSRAVLPLLARYARAHIGVARQVLTVSTADVAVARHLQIPVGTPIAEVEREVADRRGRLIYFALVRYPAKHLRIETALLER